MPALTTYRTPVLPDWVDYNGHLRLSLIHI